MNFFMLALASVALLGTSFSSIAYAIDLYVDTRTKQIYAEPGEGRVHLGTFQKVESTPRETKQETQAKGDVETKRNPATVAKRKLKDNHLTVDFGKKGLQVKTEDGDFKFKLSGRIHADASVSHGDEFLDKDGNRVEANDGTEIRRARIAFNGTFFKDWDFKSQIDFADNKVGIKDMWLRYTGLDFLQVRVGQQKQAFSRELQESSNDQIFIERSLMNVLNVPVVDRAIGLNLISHVKHGTGHFTGQIGIFGETVAANKRNNMADEGWAVNSRVTYAPIAEENRILHLGVAGNYREPDDAGDVTGKSLKYEYETTHMSNLKLLSAGIGDVNNIKMLGVEAAGVYGPFSFGGEYTNTWIDRKGALSLNFNGWYSEAAWTLTGESRRYKKGVFYKVVPNRSFSLANGGIGAWELAFRFAEVDLNDNGFRGGKLSNITIGLNWYLNENVRLMAGYDKAFRIKDSPLSKRNGRKLDDLDTFMFRSQLAF